MPGLDPGIHAFLSICHDVDGRDKRGHDDAERARPLRSQTGEGARLRRSKINLISSRIRTFKEKRAAPIPSGAALRF